MFMILDFLPTICPNCGRSLAMGKDAKDDYFHNAAHTCDCGVHFQFVPEHLILKAAEEAGGDMKYRV